MEDYPYVGYDADPYETLFERIEGNHDIVAISIVYSDETKEEIFVPKKKCGCCGTANIWQKVRREEGGFLIWICDPDGEYALAESDIDEEDT